MFEDLDPPRPVKGPKSLDKLSVAELEDYIVELQGEIDRVRETILYRQAHSEQAEAAFRKAP